MKKLCLNCDKPLVGRQRQHCSDKCRKAYKRKADKLRPGLSKAVQKTQDSEQETQGSDQNDQVGQGILSAFASDMATLDPFLKLELIKNFSRIIDYQDLWVKRCMNHEKGFPVGSRMSDVHIITANILNAIRDELTEVMT